MSTVPGPRRPIGTTGGPDAPAGATLRERLTGGGPRLPDHHVGARYRGGRNLGAGSAAGGQA